MFKFSKKIETILNIIAANARDLEVSAYFVGGMVRDMLMGIDIKDIDILIEGSAINFVQKLSQNFEGKNIDILIKSIHSSFDTVKTIINGVEIDFASTREEDYPLPGCLPVVKNIGCSIEKDLKRRDFTVNAIAARLNFKDNFLHYEIIDPYNGAGDIKLKNLKILHNKSYIDDPTRILRGIDFMFRFGFDFSKNDKILMENYLKSPDREGLSFDRVKLTIKKLFIKNHAKKAYKYIFENKIYKIWQDKPGFKLEWIDRILESVKIFDIPKEEIFLKIFFENHFVYNFLPECASNYEIYNFYKKFKPVDLAFLYSAFNDKNAVFYFQKLKDVKLDITGDDLIKQGFCQGRELGRELSRLFEAKINSVSKDKF